MPNFGTNSQRGRTAAPPTQSQQGFTSTPRDVLPSHNGQPSGQVSSEDATHSKTAKSQFQNAITSRIMRY